MRRPTNRQGRLVNPEDFFLSEWRARRLGERRSLPRARDLADVLGLRTQARPVLSVVGSKGKGTAATFASACLAAAGNRVVTVTSPGYRRATERIRENGRAISAAALTGLARRLREAVRQLPGPARAYGGYLAPTGLFTLAGVLHAADVGADVIVLEAGMGGMSDEISFFPAAVAAITPIFAEHVGTLGDTPAEIASEKAGIVASCTRAVLTVPQPADVRRVIVDTAMRRSAGRAAVEVVAPGGTAIPARFLPPGLSAVNAELGVAAAGRLLDATSPPAWPAAPHSRRVIPAIPFTPPPGLDNLPRSAVGRRPHGGVGLERELPELAAALGSVRLPGRLSRHELPGTGTELVIDSAINAAGIAAALEVARTWWTGIDHVLACMPDHKDVAGAIRELAGLPVTFVRLPGAHARFTHPLPGHWSVIDAAELTRELVAGLGRRILTVGTVYFAGCMLDLVDADTECLFVAAPALPAPRAARVRAVALGARRRYGLSRPAQPRAAP